MWIRIVLYNGNVSRIKIVLFVTIDYPIHTMKRVVITGAGVVTSLGHNLPSTWSNLLDGLSGAQTIPPSDPILHNTLPCTLALIQNFPYSSWRVPVPFPLNTARQLPPEQFPPRRLRLSPALRQPPLLPSLRHRRHKHRHHVFQHHQTHLVHL